MNSWAQRQSWRFKPSPRSAIAAVCTCACCAFESLRIQQAVPWKTGMRKLSSIHPGNISHGLGRARLLLEFELCPSIFLKRWLHTPGPVAAGVIGPWAAAEIPRRVSWMRLAQGNHCKQGQVAERHKVWFLCPSQPLRSTKSYSWGTAEVPSQSSQKPDH